MPGPLERSYYADNDYVLDNSSALSMHRSAYWALKASLMKQGSFATNSGAVSAWTCAGSSDSLTAGMDGVDRWGTTYDVTKIVVAVAPSIHSWFVVCNTTLGIWLILDMQAVTGVRQLVYVCATAPTGGTTTARPTSTTEINIGSAVFGTMSTAAGKAHRCFDSEGYFMFLLSRNGGSIHTAFGIQKVSDTRLSDTKPWVLICDTGIATNDTTTACRGDSNSATVDCAGWKGTLARGRCYSPLDGTTAMTVIPAFWGGTGANGYFAGHMTGADAADGNFDDGPLNMVGTSGIVSIKGRLYDWRQMAGPPAGACYPSATAMTHLAVGNCWIPWTSPPTV